MRRCEGETGDGKFLRLFRKLLLAEVAPNFAPASNLFLQRTAPPSAESKR